MKSKLMKKLSFSLMILLGIGSLLAIIYAPIFLKEQIEFRLSKEINNEVKLEGLLFSLSPLSIQLNNFSIKNGPKLSQIQLTLSLQNLIDKKVNISEIYLNGLDIQITDDRKIRGINLSKKTNDQKKGNNDWKFLINKVIVNQSKISFPKNHLLKIKSLKLSDLAFPHLTKTISYHGEFSINNSPLKVNGSSLLTKNNTKTKIKVELEKLNLELLKDVPQLSELNSIEGFLSFDGQIELENKTKNINGDIHVDNLKVLSKENDLVDYYAKKLSFYNLHIAMTQDLTINAKEILSENLILSIPISIFNKKKDFSKFATLKVQDLSFWQRLSQDNKKSGDLLKVSASLGQHSDLKVLKNLDKNGEALNITIQGMNLTPFNETFEQLISYQVESGKLDLNLYTLTNGEKIKGKTEILLNQFRLDSSAEDGRKIKNDSLIPLPTAVSMIRDDQGQISTSLDIYGEKNNPNFGFLPMLKKGIGKVLVSQLTTMIAAKAATKFLPMLVSSIPFSPANAFILAQGGYKLLTKPRFESISFKSRTDEIEDSSLKQVKRVASLLKDNEKIFLKLCPVTSINERVDKNTPPLSKEEALKLAQLRLKKVSQKFESLDTKLKQVIFCRPTITKKEIKKGRLTISL